MMIDIFISIPGILCRLAIYTQDAGKAEKYYGFGTSGYQSLNPGIKQILLNNMNRF